MKKITAFMEPKSWLRKLETAALALLIICTLLFSILGLVKVWHTDKGGYTYEGTATFVRMMDEEEEYSSDEFVTAIAVYYNADQDIYCFVSMPAEDWEELPEEHSIEAHVYRFSEGQAVAFDHEASEDEILAGVKEVYAEEAKGLWNAALALGLMAISLAVVTFFATKFSTYEKIWFSAIMVLATIFAIVMPEESANGVNGIWIMLLYLFDTFLNILCELLLSKQSKWNFIVSVLVEITEILICLVLAYRWATFAVTLFFWLPIDILSFINWHRHPDKQEDDLTVVRKLSGWQEILVLVGIAVWTVVVGYFLSGLDIATDLFGGNEVLENVVCYLDACASAVGIANGLFIFFRLKEQWVAWITVSVLEALINILSGQWVLLPLKLGYFTNSVYGLSKWTRYIKEHKKEESAKPEFF